jgi:alpha 1,2-mannosyltransferase
VERRARAAFVILARNSDVAGVRSSMQMLEDRFNKRYKYPYIFLNDKEFTEEFKEATSTMTEAETMYGKIPEEHWSYPSWIDQTLAAENRRKLQKDNVIYGGSESYRHMCR